MALLTISDAARCCGVHRSTLQRAINAGKLSRTDDHQVDTAELLRAGFTLQHPAAEAAVPHAASVRQAAAGHDMPHGPGVPQPAAEGAAATAAVLAALRQRVVDLEEIMALLRADRDAAALRETVAREERALLLQMLHEAQTRTDRLLQAPAAALSQAAPGAPPTRLPHGSMRRRIAALLVDYSEGLTPVEMRTKLGVAYPLGNTVMAMCRDGWLLRLRHGVYGRGPRAPAATP